MIRTEPQTQFIVNNQGERTAVVLTIADYERMVEDLHDLALIAERKDEGAITLDELKRRLGW